MPRVLLVDDDPGTLETWGALLRSSGFEVLSAESGRHGLELALTTDPHVILIDFRLPDMSGVEMLESLRVRQLRTAVVLVTGFGTIRSAVQAIRLGAVDYVEKPLVGDALIRTVEWALSAHAAEQQPEAHDAVSTEAHSARRWADAVARIVDLPADPKTIGGWGRAIGVSRGTLKNWCRTIGLSSKRSLDFGRLLRAVIRQSLHGIRPEHSLDVVDQRTLARLLSFTGASRETPALAPHVDAFLDGQILIRDSVALCEVRRCLGSRSARPRHA
jgi:FixJ family two-component response regulator